MSAPLDHATLASDRVTPARSEVLPHELPDVLDDFPMARVLSLDCFDTLIWRDTYRPVDVFKVLPGIAGSQRARAEEAARRAAHLMVRGEDITIAEIYDKLMPGAAPETREAAIRAELDAEATHCYAFTPTVELIRRAKARGMQVVIVSDTYLSEDMLRELIARAGGEELSAMIDRVFVSSHWRLPKARGLYRHVLPELGVDAAAVLHIGDNLNADVRGVTPFGVQAVHLKQFHAEIERQLRLEACLDTLLSEGKGTLGAPQPHRAALAQWTPQLTDTAQHFGYAVLGPVFAGYDRWLDDEAEALRQRHGGTVHRLFLMRDGHLPMQVHRQRSGDQGHAVEISRFTATGAIFTTDAAIDAYVEDQLGTDPAVIARQLLAPPAEVKKLAAIPDKTKGTQALYALLDRREIRRFIHKAARRMADRIITHIRHAADPRPGDTLMLIDLGYNGSVQNRIDALLAEAMGVHVAGRYLLLREVEVSGLDKAGYFDERHYDHDALGAMANNVAVFEQFCTNTAGSVIDYTERGAPIRRANDIKQAQSAIREAAQQGCLHFARTQPAASQRASRDPAMEAEHWRRANAATLTRLMFLPMPYELGVFESFEHDVNLGTDETIALFHKGHAQRGLRQQGLFYLKGARRMFLPAELSEEGMATRLAYLATSRFGMMLNVGDFVAEGGFLVPTIYSNGQEVVETRFNALPTHNGYHSLCIPIGDCRFTAAIQFGALFDWVEIYSITALPQAEHLNNKHDTASREIAMSPLLEGIEARSGNLWQCTSPHGFALINPPPRGDDTPMMLLVVFRPVTWKEGVTV
ncbi:MULTISPECIES: HAD family hydrolase [unclassified Novosphingobium]|uniref:HAD family hydrolase n=1 Tax=unclassified Novosphingobium TaxID=2644732 RepID=UPI000B0C63A2|nr:MULTISPECIES: HAD family hydrolase [unclassified Novosphingobium]MBN9143221.1 HAD family hydrolase [Novosphingobium sp.]MDR6706309.1 FMN phosphatase YigB (HAD superfamily) [Novosphingobium sp. 1748]